MRTQTNSNGNHVNLIRIALIVEPSDYRVKPHSAGWRLSCSKFPYVWSLPYNMRDCFNYYTLDDVERILACDVILVTGGMGLELLESRGLDIRNTKCSYDALLGASVMLGHARVIVAPKLSDILAFGRTMRFLYVRSMDRILRPASYLEVPAFVHVHIHQGTQGMYLKRFQEYFKHPSEGGASLMSVDLETTYRITTKHEGVTRNWGACITVVGYAFAFFIDGKLHIESYTQEFRTEEDYALASAVMASDTFKTFHHGQYDVTYLTRWGMVCHNCVHDTQNWMKSVTPHLKKRSRGKETKGFYSLQACSHMYLMDSTYWKDGRKSSGMEYFRYCAMDCFRTLCIAVKQLHYPSRATADNYALSAYLLPSCTVAGLRGFRILEDERKKVQKEYLDQLAEDIAWIESVTGYAPSQSAQLLPLFAAMGKWALENKVTGAREVSDTGKNSRRDISEWNPIFAVLMARISVARRRAGWLSSYILKAGWSAESMNGGFGPAGEYFLFKLDPFGTDSRRLASSASHLWIGGNAQNVPKQLRKMFAGYDGCELNACDLSAAETRTTAYLSKCNEMREAVEGARDFHSDNAAFFFSMKYEDIYDDVLKKVKSNFIRTLGKRVNHAANYLMGDDVFIETVGVTLILSMKELLNLPVDWTLRAVAAFVLNRFDERFPGVRTRWATEQAREVLRTGRLQCVTGYKPLFLESPAGNKRILNQCVATESQHFSAQISLAIFHELWLAEQRHPDMLYILLQVHDENVFGSVAGAPQDVINDIYLKAADAEIPMNFKWRDGTDAVLRMPSDKPIHGKTWYDVKG